ncbi:uncharacterized protein G2W53_040223 [Senna tora]|uniref:Uncharacterized protein n=1 Tax=Senna tora TaxID=362788 RepID=A0A834SQQ2_9FABA|nr:uncharacterized protein G2W53_040223 [Senna tora]
MISQTLTPTSLTMRSPLNSTPRMVEAWHMSYSHMPYSRMPLLISISPIRFRIPLMPLACPLTTPVASTYVLAFADPMVGHALTNTLTIVLWLTSLVLARLKAFRPKESRV